MVYFGGAHWSYLCKSLGRAFGPLGGRHGGPEGGGGGRRGEGKMACREIAAIANKTAKSLQNLCTINGGRLYTSLQT